MIPVVVISLERSTDRRAYIGAHLASLGIPFRFFAAIDGNTLSPSARARYEPTMPLGAMGCAESHLASLREIADGADKFVCTLEDDAEISPQARTLFDLSTLQGLPIFDVLRLETQTRPGKRPSIPIATFDGFSLSSGLRHHPAMTAQIFSREGARKIVARIGYLRVAIDVALFLDSYVPGLRVVEARPTLARPSGIASTIGPGCKPPYSQLEALALRRLRIREVRNIVSFLRAWSVSDLLRMRSI